jgi:hypothetical protein
VFEGLDNPNLQSDFYEEMESKFPSLCPLLATLLADSGADRSIFFRLQAKGIM